MRPKILLCFEYGTLNGGEISLLAVLESLGRKTFAFVAAVPPDSLLAARLAALGIQTVPWVLDKGRPHGEIVAYLCEHVTQLAPDLVHANSLSMGRMIGRIAPRLPMPCTSHLRDIIKLSQAAIGDLNQNAGLVAVSHATQAFHAGQGLQTEKVQVIYNGVDTDRFRPSPQPGSLRKSLELRDDDILIANIGQICLRKGQTLLAQAAVALAKTIPNAHYLFVGERYSQKAESAAYEETIRHHFDVAGMSDHLFCLGFREDIPLILNDVDLLVHTAHQEPLGRVLLEAASCAKAIVATDVGGTGEILVDGQSALLVPPDDLGALCAAIRKLIADPDLRDRLGRQARDTVNERFSIPDTTERTKAFWVSHL